MKVKTAEKPVQGLDSSSSGLKLVKEHYDWKKWSSLPEEGKVEVMKGGKEYLALPYR